MIREGDAYAKKLLAVFPEGADAYLTLGPANFIIGSLPAHKRFFLVFTGIYGDKSRGIQQRQFAMCQHPEEKSQSEIRSNVNS